MANEQGLVERLLAGTMGFDWSDLPDNAEIKAVPLYVRLPTPSPLPRYRREGRRDAGQ